MRIGSLHGERLLYCYVIDTSTFPETGVKGQKELVEG